MEFFFAISQWAKRSSMMNRRAVTSGGDPIGLQGEGPGSDPRRKNLDHAVPRRR